MMDRKNSLYRARDAQNIARLQRRLATGEVQLAESSATGVAIASASVGVLLGYGGTEVAGTNPQVPGTEVKVPGKIAGIPTAMLLGGLILGLSAAVSGRKAKAAVAGLGGGMLAGGIGSIARRGGK